MSVDLTSLNHVLNGGLDEDLAAFNPEMDASVSVAAPDMLTAATASGIKSVTGAIDAAADSMVAASVFEMPETSFGLFQACTILVALIAVYFVAQSKKLSTNKRNIAVMAGSAASAWQLLLLVMFYRSRRHAMYWVMFAVLALLAAIFIYTTVIAFQC